MKTAPDPLYVQVLRVIFIVTSHNSHSQWICTTHVKSNKFNTYSYKKVT